MTATGLKAGRSSTPKTLSIDPYSCLQNKNIGQVSYFLAILRALIFQARNMSFWNRLKSEIKNITNISDHIDTDAAESSIVRNVQFRGPNVWILAFSIVVASVGLNVNSTAVIIGAMLISPLMGPIFGIGLGFGINDSALIKSGLKNLVVMVAISLLASFIYFLLTPLKLANPTELLARTNPTIYDVVIALFGGAAGMFEISRKEKGTVLSGVAIATALMPPLCTAGYGLASFNMRYFLGALLLFIINGVFIILATYMMSKVLGFREKEFPDPVKAKRTKTAISAIIVLVMIPSVLSAVRMIRDNGFQQEVSAFIDDNKILDSGYIYDYEIDSRKGGKVTVYIAGAELMPNDKERLLASAESHGVDEDRIEFVVRSSSESQLDKASENLVRGIYERTDLEISRRDARIRELEEELSSYRKAEIPFMQISKEISAQYPQIRDMSISRGAEVSVDSLSQKECILVVVRTESEMRKDDMKTLESWLQLRLADSTVTVMNSRPRL